VRKRAAERGGLVVVRGAKGIGKSTAVRVALYRVLQLPLKVDNQYYKPVAVAVREYDRDKAERFTHAARGLGLYPIFYLDPSSPRAYPKEPAGPYQPEISIEEVRSAVVRMRDVTGAVAVVVLSNDQYRAVENLVDNAMVIDADQLLAPKKEKYVEALVKSYSNCPSEVVESVAGAIASQYDNYAVAAVLAADWLRRSGCGVEGVEKIVENTKGDIHRFILHYLWYGLFKGSNAAAERYAPLLLAVGFFGPHPPKLAEAIVRAFGEKPEDTVIRWFSQPLHGTLYEAIRKVAHGAVYKRFKVGNYELCHGSKEESCRLVEICSKVLKKVLQKGYSVEEVTAEYAKLVAKALEAPGPDGERQIDSLIDDFLQAYDHVAEDGRWRIRYETKGPGGVKTVEDVVDELDVLSALYGMATLPGRTPQSLEGWFFVGNMKVGVVSLYLYPHLRERSEELIRRAAMIVHEIGKRGFHTTVDAGRAMGIVAAGQWNNATDEELEKAVKLASATLLHFASASFIVLNNIESLLSETWRRLVGGRTRVEGERRRRVADVLTLVIHNAVSGHLISLPFLFTVGLDKHDRATLAQRFNVLYNATSNLGRRLLLDMLLYALEWGVYGISLVAMLLGKPQVGPKEAFEEVTKRVKKLVSNLHGVEKAYIAAPLYPRLAMHYTYFGEFDKAVEHAEEALKELDELWKAYERDKASVEEVLRPYLQLRRLKPDLEEELNDISTYVYHHVAFVYMAIDELDKAMKCAERACELARKLGYVSYEVLSCGMPPRLETVRGGVPPVEEFEGVWQMASQAVDLLGAETVAAALGHYVVALASTGDLGKVEEVLKEWGWVLELYPTVSGLTYGVLSLFDKQYIERAAGHLSEWTRANLPKLADVMHDAVETGLFARDLKIAELAWKTLNVVYYEEGMVNALFEVASKSDNLFLSALVGLAHCKKGEEWGLKLARAAARAVSNSKGIAGRLFGELVEALKMATMGNCIIYEALKAVYKLYYFHV